ncbi:MAG: chemotaxis protein methyltransferase CheR [Parcubacteria group bacterium Gr01-1014_20]|nr:MAG: chemotaxis protein methyltransferase CheR [Parcubacteria group bacterium Gr01-1014_20]
MEATQEKVESALQPVGADFFKRLWEESWTYIKTVVDVVREPILILDKDLRVMAANEAFYREFQVEAKDTEKKIVYDLGNGQWNILALKKLLEDILPLNTFFKGFEVTHDFPFIGRKVMILNARQIHSQDKPASESFPPIILLAMEDVTEMMDVAKTLADHTSLFETRLTEKTQNLEVHIGRLEEEINELKKKAPGSQL